MFTTENSFTPADLFNYAEMLLRESKLREANEQECTNYYGWLSSRHLQIEELKNNQDLEMLRPIIQKMSPENCAKIAFKLDSLTDGVHSSTAILNTFKNLLEEHHNMQLIDNNVSKAKERGFKKNRHNKVRPVLVPYGRQPTVSFILDF